MYAYDMPNEELLKEFTRAAAEVGIASSGLCIDVMANLKFEEFNYLKGVVLSRLEGLKSSFTRGDKVVVKSGITSRPRSPNFSPALKSDMDEALVVSRTHYTDKEWFLEFRNLKEGVSFLVIYPAKDFELKK